MGRKEFAGAAGLGGLLGLALKAVLLSPEGQQLVQPDMVPVVIESLSDLDVTGLISWTGTGAAIGGVLNLVFGKNDRGTRLESDDDGTHHPGTNHGSSHSAVN